MTDAITGIDQADYMKLFMQELTYQDPLKPIDNREFMAQMAQFSALQQAVQTNESLDTLLGMVNGNQGMMLLGRRVRFQGSNELATVQSVLFPPNEPPKITALLNGTSLSKGIGDIAEVQ